ncbi:transposase [Colletotrichum incanum]|uniref:Transposase n=1 Tax=Colletotrichum incanum TaxID=1573173 RepID=A0A167ATY4_COLIC|nr:transposase [Colletotrichum incanum]
MAGHLNYLQLYSRRLRKLMSWVVNCAYSANWIKKGQKGFQEQFFQLTTVQQEIQLLQAQVRNSAAGKRKAVKVDTNSKFANLSNIRQSYIEADEVEIDTDGSSSSNYPTEDESCI